MNRRTRAATAKAGTKSTIATNGTSSVIDVTAKASVTALNDFASPKRKDCKLDIDSSPLNQNMVLNGSGGKRSANKGIAKTKKPHQSAITNFFHKDRKIDTSASESNNHDVNVDESDNSIQNQQFCDKDSLPADALKQNGVHLNEKEKIGNVDVGIDVVDNGVAMKNGDGFNSFFFTSPPPKLRNSNDIKQTTPHRIVAPSSPSKKQKYAVPSFSDLNIDDDVPSDKHTRKKAAKKTQKNKRRLHVNGTENSISKVNEEETANEAIVISDDSSDSVPTNEASNESEVDLNKNVTSEKLNKKLVLNSSIEPTAQQNTTNNNKIPATSMSVTSQQANAMPRTHATQMTDYFPIRRSARKTKKMVEEEHLRYIEVAIEKQHEDGLLVKDFGEKGRGIVAGRAFQRGEFIVEYIGELIDQTEADRREEEYAKNADFGCYMYYFKHKEQQWCIDATEDRGKLGRLVNHSRNGNLMTKIVNYKNTPHLVLLAKDDIKEGVELTYDYGDRRREALLHHPWLAF